MTSMADVQKQLFAGQAPHGHPDPEAWRLQHWPEWIAWGRAGSHPGRHADMLAAMVANKEAPAVDESGGRRLTEGELAVLQRHHAEEDAPRDPFSRQLEASVVFLTQHMTQLMEQLQGKQAAEIEAASTTDARRQRQREAYRTQWVDALRAAGQDESIAAQEPLQRVSVYKERMRALGPQASGDKGAPSVQGAPCDQGAPSGKRERSSEASASPPKRARRGAVEKEEEEAAPGGEASSRVAVSLAADEGEEVLIFADPSSTLQDVLAAWKRMTGLSVSLSELELEKDEQGATVSVRRAVQGTHACPAVEGRHTSSLYSDREEVYEGLQGEERLVRSSALGAAEAGGGAPARLVHKDFGNRRELYIGDAGSEVVAHTVPPDWRGAIDSGAEWPRGLHVRGAHVPLSHLGASARAPLKLRFVAIQREENEAHRVQAPAAGAPADETPEVRPEPTTGHSAQAEPEALAPAQEAAPKVSAAVPPTASAVAPWRRRETRVVVHTFETEEAAIAREPTTEDTFDVAPTSTIGEVLALWRQKYRNFPDVEMEFEGEVIANDKTLAGLAKQERPARTPLCFVVVPMEAE